MHYIGVFLHLDAAQNITDFCFVLSLDAVVSGAYNVDSLNPAKGALTNA